MPKKVKTAAKPPVCTNRCGKDAKQGENARLCLECLPLMALVVNISRIFDRPFPER